MLAAVCDAGDVGVVCGSLSELSPTVDPVVLGVCKVILYNTACILLVPHI